jgi:hypothetical protein
MHARFWKRIHWMGLIVGALSLACASTRATAPEQDRIGVALETADADHLASRWAESAQKLEAAVQEARSLGDPRLPRLELAWGRVLVDLGRKDRAVGD